MILLLFDHGKSLCGIALHCCGQAPLRAANIAGTARCFSTGNCAAKLENLRKVPFPRAQQLTFVKLDQIFTVTTKRRYKHLTSSLCVT